MSDMLASSAGQVGQATGLSNIGQGVSDLFSGGPTPGPGTPGSPDFVGPPSPVTSPSFLQGFAQGFTGMQPGKGADVLSTGGAVGGGIGQLFNAINQLRNPQGLLQSGLQQLAGGPTGPLGAQTPMVNVPSTPPQGPEQPQIPPGYVQAKAEDPMQAIMKLAMIVAAL